MPSAPAAPRAGGPCWAPPRPAPRPCRLPVSFPGLASSALAPGPGTLSGKALGTPLVRQPVCVCVAFVPITPCPRACTSVHRRRFCRRLCLEHAAPLSALLTELPSLSSSGSPGARLLLRWFRGVSRYVTPSHTGRGAASPYREVFSGALDSESRGF